MKMAKSDSGHLGFGFPISLPFHLERSNGSRSGKSPQVHIQNFVKADLGCLPNPDSRAGARI